MKMWEILEKSAEDMYKDKHGYRRERNDDDEMSGMRSMKDKIEEAYKCGYKDGFKEGIKESSEMSGFRMSR